MSRDRLVLAVTTVSLLGTLALAGVVVWMAADPRYWFPDAFAAQGPRGDEGPRGDRGPRGLVGRAGPAGPGVEDIAASVDELSGTVDDAVSQADEAVARVDDVEGRISDLESINIDSRLTEAEDQAAAACDALFYELDTYGC